MEDMHRTLLAQAKKAVKLAYAEYSKFQVGAAVLANGEIFQGANIENASSNLGICAERVAIAHARMRLGKKMEIEGIAVFCEDSRGENKKYLALEETMPCGACRQWLTELAANAWVVTNGSDKVFTVLELLPRPFSLPRS
ncbi:MAG: cytidine deaminase [Burkholderiaceae bacterium]|jgi:cytidine deaminase